MGSTAALSAIGQGTQGLAAVGGAYSQSKAMSTQGDYQKQVADQNAKFALVQSADALERGTTAANRSNQKYSGMVGSQRAGYAGQGVDVNSGSAAEVQSSTQAIGALDALTIKNNAWKESWGYKAQASGYTAQGQMQQSAANNQAGQTLLTGGMQALASGMKGVASYGSSFKSGDNTTALTIAAISPDSSNTYAGEGDFSNIA